MGSRIVHTISDGFCADRFLAPLLRRLKDSYSDVGLIIGPKSDFYDVDIELPVPTHKFKIGLTLNPLALVSRVWVLYRFFLCEKTQVVHSHMTKASLIPLLAAWLAKVPNRIYHNHGFPFLGYSGPLRWALLLLEKLLFALSTKVLCVSRSNLDEAVQVGLAKDSAKATVVGFGSAVGVSLERFIPMSTDGKALAKRQLGLSGAVFVVGYVGRPVRRKGFHLLLESWSEIHKVADNAFLLLAGCSQQDCEKVMKSLPAQVVPLGLVENMQMFYSACDLIVLPSFHEGLGNALIEGGMSGCALVGSNIPGIKDTIEADRNGILFQLGSKTQLQRALLSFIQDPTKTRQMGELSSQKMRREFEQETVVQGYLDFYKDVFSSYSLK